MELGLAARDLMIDDVGGRVFRRSHALAAARDIPVVGRRECIADRGGSIRGAQLGRGGHRRPSGHRWAAEAPLDHLRRSLEVCWFRA